MTLPTSDENPDGLHQRYLVRKLDGCTDPDAAYFVLRLDSGGDDSVWIECCRIAAIALVKALRVRGHLPQLSEEIRKYVMTHWNGNGMENGKR